MADEKAKRRACLRCGRIVQAQYQYCPDCGAPVTNRCMDEGDLLDDPCGFINDDQAAYCVRCGSITAYNKAGLLFGAFPENKVLKKYDIDEWKQFSHPFFY
ncbi:hypothetical protein BG53_07290 [Paenibacillus darwinianus]|uniref:DZANK-type domain-containing protein n=1 Tax=Paenibacillus darwinianus TaxID=1380763 RepID=A0A9W5W6K8_9BACL|nr:zinc ribbon domain-containing protein [Paenibacillus darwinianus]EXX85791.1 hypothetical protein CH50_08745 [Paenibacillus darwinianus]EXX85966.1 hypothetical protein BG53_07290 [Paenibacillus darwinianus]EXX88674.1 hypothetical protein BG52_01525 [Paenibacillus darwinianus]